MRVSQKDKDRSGHRIVASAARLMRERGVEGASVGEVMRGAGMTLGGFYRHFESKDALVSAAVEAAFDQMLGGLESNLDHGDPAAVIADFERYYLSDEHVRDRASGCPVSALAGELGRGPVTSEAPLSSGVNRMIELIASGLRGSPRVRRAEAARRFATMVGAVTIARATDADTAKFILEATRAHLTTPTRTGRS